MRSYPIQNKQNCVNTTYNAGVICHVSAFALEFFEGGQAGDIYVHLFDVISYSISDEDCTLCGLLLDSADEPSGYDGKSLRSTYPLRELHYLSISRRTVALAGLRPTVHVCECIPDNFRSRVLTIRSFASPRRDVSCVLILPRYPETVYGLGANALSESAVLKIFEVRG